MTGNHDYLWPGGTYQSAKPPLAPSLIELAVQCSGQSIKRNCVSHLHRLHLNLSRDQLLGLICEDCPVRIYIASQVKRQEWPKSGPKLVANLSMGKGAPSRSEIATPLPLQPADHGPEAAGPWQGQPTQISNPFRHIIEPKSVEL